MIKGVSNGRDYRGRLNVTEKGDACINWKGSGSYEDDFSVNTFGLEENYCRDPSWHTNPWCYIRKAGKRSWGNCVGIPYCDEQLKRLIEEDIPRTLNINDDELSAIENTNIDEILDFGDKWVDGYKTFLFLLSTKVSKAHRLFEALMKNGKAEELLQTLVQLMQGVQKMNLKDLDEADQKELKTVASLIFSYLEKEKKLKGREIFRAVSVEHNNLLAEYQSIFPETDEDFETCVRDGWIDLENCKALTNSYKALENLADIGHLSNHPLHIKDSRGNLNPSSFIPFCRVGGKMVSDRNLFPVHTQHQID